MAEAAAQGVTVTALAVRCLLLGLDLPAPPEPSDGRIVAAVAELFDELQAPDADLGLHRELALLLARTAERERGPAQVGAVRELRDLARKAVGENDAQVAGVPGAPGHAGPYPTEEASSDDRDRAVWDDWVSAAGVEHGL